MLKIAAGLAIAALLIAGPARSQMMMPRGAETMATVGAGGEVFIDWRVVRRTAEGQGEPVLVAAARIMLAIRDGKWKPMPK